MIINGTEYIEGAQHGDEMDMVRAAAVEHMKLLNEKQLAAHKAFRAAKRQEKAAALQPSGGEEE